MPVGRSDIDLARKYDVAVLRMLRRERARFDQYFGHQAKAALAEVQHNEQGARKVMRKAAHELS
jgi:hypothetical protein